MNESSIVTAQMATDGGCTVFAAALMQGRLLQLDLWIGTSSEHPSRVEVLSAQRVFRMVEPQLPECILNSGYRLWLGNSEIAKTKSCIEINTSRATFDVFNSWMRITDSTLWAQKRRSGAIHEKPIIREVNP